MVGKPTRNCRCPENDETIMRLVVEEFRGPHVNRCRLTFHYWNEPLRRPMHQVARIRITKPLIRFPAGRPDKMKGTVGMQREARVAHQPARPHLGLQKSAGHVLPAVAVLAVQESKPILSIVAK